MKGVLHGTHTDFQRTLLAALSAFQQGEGLLTKDIFASEKSLTHKVRLSPPAKLSVMVGALASNLVESQSIPKAENPAAFKHLFNQDLLKHMAKALHQVYPKFDKKN
ncbi:MAG: hypothetical protein ACOH5I_09275 [Oligoflexus sp.]